MSYFEKILFSFFALIFFISSFYLLALYWFLPAKEVKVRGGEYREGIVGELRIINPLYAVSDAERDVAEILFRGLTKSGIDGRIIPDLAESYKASEDGKVYEFKLKDDIFWSDGKPITSDDVVFTVKIMKDPAYRSYNLASWLEIGVEKIDEKRVKFRLKDPYLPFLELATFKVLPKHIWQNVPPQEFSLVKENLKPVTSGPYRVKEIFRDDLGFIKEIKLEPNPYYDKEKPYIEEVSLIFLSSLKEALQKADLGQIDGIAFTEPADLSLGFFKKYNFELPRYFALFFNTESKFLKDKDVRKAIALSINRKEIIDKALKGKGKVLNSLLLTDFYGFNFKKKELNQDLVSAELLLSQAGFKFDKETGFRFKETKSKPKFVFTKDLDIGSQGLEVRKLQECLAQDPEVYPEGQITGYFGRKTKSAVIRFQEKYRKEILEPQNLKKGTGAVRGGTRAKLNQICFSSPPEKEDLVLSFYTVNQPVLAQVSNLIKQQIEKVGIKVNLKTLPLNDLLENYIKPREYDLLLFGQLLGSLPDFYPFWHSNQADAPGLNLSKYKNKEADKLIEEIRRKSKLEDIKEPLEELNNVLFENLPAFPLYVPEYSFYVHKRVKGIIPGKIADPSKRFWNIEDWYIKTKRVLK